MLLKEKVVSSDGRILHLLLIPIVIFLIFALIVFTVILRLRSPAGRGFATLSPPVQVIWSMYEAGMRGNTKAYMDCFVPDSQGAIRETLKSKGEEAFKAYLRETFAGIMGISILSQDKLNFRSNPFTKKQENISEGDLISIPVEIVFRGKNKLQVFNLKRVGGLWKILNVSAPIITDQPIPYGKNVNE